MDDWCGKTDHWLHAPKSWSGDPAKRCEDAEFWQQVRACFGALPERQAQVFALRTYDDLEANDKLANPPNGSPDGSDTRPPACSAITTPTSSSTTSRLDCRSSLIA